MPPGIIESFFLIFFGASVLAALALFSRQPLIIAYIVTGCMFGPHALGWVDDPNLLVEISRIGIIFLLFLIGLDLPPNKLTRLRSSIITVLLSSLVFFGVGFGVLYGFGFSRGEAVVGGVAAMFSSTVMGLKLLPTTVLHHRHTGEVVVSLLLMQDLIAVVALIVIAGYGGDAEETAINMLLVLALLPVLVALAFAGARYLIVPLIKRFDAFHEFIFLLAIGWCLALATLAHSVDLSFEIGAFVAGVSLANSPIAHFITLTLRPL
ncbi:MAG: cation:proton antiporter, partial [Pseudomonadales bacterium]